MEEHKFYFQSLNEHHTASIVMINNMHVTYKTN